jgi:hypothetical protein
MLLGAVVRGLRLRWVGFYWEILSLAAILAEPAPTMMLIFSPTDLAGYRMMSDGHYD